MNFEETIAGLQPLFERHNFKVIEKGEGLIHFQSDLVSARFGYDWRDNSISFFIGKINGPKSEINDKNLKDVFNHVKDDNSHQSYLQNMLEFLNGNGKSLLIGDETKLTELEDYDSKQAEIYTAN
ncbi:MAG TPA: hypothetical protein VIY47_04665, partial [Ignavibacteriaceae bacterium]